MSDVVSPAVRSRMMSGIKGKNTKPEILVRKLLFAAGYRFRLHRSDLPGSPDIVMPGKKVAIFVHGCFWHLHKECKYAKIPGTRRDFWISKLQANVVRDQRATDQLAAMGWRIMCVWECAIRNHDTVKLLNDQLIRWIDGDSQFGEIRSLPAS